MLAPGRRSPAPAQSSEQSAGVWPGRAGRVVLDRSLRFWVRIREPGMMGRQRLIWRRPIPQEILRVRGA